MKFLKTYEQNNLNGEYFLEIGENVFQFLYDIEIINNKKKGKHVDLYYKYGNIRFEAYKNSYYQITVEKILTPDIFYKKHPDICVILYNELSVYIKKYPGNNSIDRYIKLLETLENIEDLKIYINTKKYNL